MSHLMRQPLPSIKVHSRSFIGRRSVSGCVEPSQRFLSRTPVAIIPDHQLIDFARPDDFFSVLYSGIHDLWTR